MIGRFFRWRGNRNSGGLRKFNDPLALNDAFQVRVEHLHIAKIVRIGLLEIIDLVCLDVDRVYLSISLSRSLFGPIVVIDAG